MVINIVMKELAVTTTVFISLQSGVYAVLLCAPTCWFVRTRIEISFGELFGNFDGFAPWCLGVCVQEECGEAHPPHCREQQPRLLAATVRHLIWSIRFLLR